MLKRGPASLRYLNLAPGLNERPRCAQNLPCALSSISFCRYAFSACSFSYSRRSSSCSVPESDSFCSRTRPRLRCWRAHRRTTSGPPSSYSRASSLAVSPAINRSTTSCLRANGNVDFFCSTRHSLPRRHRIRTVLPGRPCQPRPFQPSAPTAARRAFSCRGFCRSLHMIRTTV